MDDGNITNLWASRFLTDCAEAVEEFVLLDAIVKDEIVEKHLDQILVCEESFIEAVALRRREENICETGFLDVVPMFYLSIWAAGDDERRADRT